MLHLNDMAVSDKAQAAALAGKINALAGRPVAEVCVFVGVEGPDTFQVDPIPGHRRAFANTIKAYKGLLVR